MKSLILPFLVLAPLMGGCEAMQDDARRDAVLVDVFQLVKVTLDILDTVAK